MRTAPAARWSLVLLLVLVTAGCQVSPPEWQYFDVDRHPVGAVPSNVGFYGGAYVVGPCLLWLLALISGIGGHGGYSPSWEETRGWCLGIGVGTGVLIGLPFHVVALPFGDRGGNGTAAEEVQVGPDPVRDETPPEVPRDYPWPPKPAR